MPARDLIDLVALGALWGAAFLFMRVAAPAFGPLPLIAVRVTVAAVVLLPLLVRGDGVRRARAALGPLVIVGAAGTAIPFTLFAYAALTLPAGLSSVLNATVPLFGAVVGYVWLRQRPTRLKVAGLAVGFVGVLVLAWPRLSSGGDWTAVAAALTAGLLYAVSAHVTHRSLGGVGAGVVAAASQTAAAVLLAPFALLAWPATMPTPSAWLYAVLLGVGCTAIAFAIYFRLIARAGSSTAMAVTYLIPVFGVTWGALLLDERLPASALGGAALVLAGVALATWAPSPEPAR